MEEKENKELQDAINHFEAIAEIFRLGGEKETEHAIYAKLLKKLKYYEACIASGELRWKKEKKQNG